MLPAANRLRTAAEFRETTRRGRKSARGCVVVYLSTSGESESARVGVVTAKSVGGSVARHRAARRIRGAIRPLIDQIPRGSRLVVRALPGADTDPALPNDLAACVARAVARS